MRPFLMTAILSALLLTAGCRTAPQTQAERDNLVAESRAKLDLLKSKNTGLYRLYQDDSAAVAVFPRVSEGGLIIGYGFGQGVLFEDGKAVGFCALDEGSGGALIGIKRGTQFVFLEDSQAVKRFKAGGLELTAQVDSIAANKRAGKQAHYDNGIAVIVINAQGLMAEASVSGQKFRYKPMEAVR